MDYKKKFLELRGWQFVKEPLYTKSDGHGSRQKNVIYGHREYAVKDDIKLSVVEAYDFEQSKLMCELAEKNNLYCYEK